MASSKVDDRLHADVSSTEPKRAFKVVLVGNPQVGKTSIRRKYMGKSFKSQYLRTIGADFATRKIKMDNEVVLLTIWDIAGQTLFKDFAKSFYQGSRSALIVIDVTDIQSLTDSIKWAKEAVANSKGLISTLYLIANKIDLHDQRQVSLEQVMDMAKRMESEIHLPVTVVETSALTGININALFDDLCKNLLLIDKDSSLSSLPRIRYLSGSAETPLVETPSPSSSQSLAERLVALEKRVEQLANEFSLRIEILEEKVNSLLDAEVRRSSVSDDRE